MRFKIQICFERVCLRFKIQICFERVCLRFKIQICFERVCLRFKIQICFERVCLRFKIQINTSCVWNACMGPKGAVDELVADIFFSRPVWCRCTGLVSQCRPQFSKKGVCVFEILHSKVLVVHRKGYMLCFYVCFGVFL